MGKSTTARMFAHEGVAVWDADAAVHRLYARGGAAVAPIAEAHPEAIRDGAVSREALKAWIAGDDTALKRLEAIVHPLVRADREAYMTGVDADIVLFDIPLLFETGSDADMDLTIAVSSSAEEQKRRVLERGTMDEAEFDRIRAAQLSDGERRAKADRVIETTTPEAARAQVQAILAEIRETLDA